MMSHNIHEPNHAGDCIFCGQYVGKSYKMASSAHADPTDTNQASEVKRNSLNKSDEDVKLEPMTNKASEDELRDLVIKTMRYANSVTPHKLNEPIDPFVDGAIDFAVDEMKALIRTEKLKLLAEVRERVLGEDRLLMTMRPPMLKVDPSSGRSGDEIEYLTEMNTRLDNDHAQYNRVYAQSQLQAEQRTKLTKLEAEL